jgi:hypothetical protein
VDSGLITTILLVLGGIAFFVGLAFILSKFIKSAAIETMELLPDEALHFDDSKVMVTLKSTNPDGGAMLPWGVVRVTNKRVLLGQRSLFGSKNRHQVMGIAWLEEARPAEGRLAWAEMQVDPSAIQIDENRIELPVQHLKGAHWGTHRVIIKSKRVDLYRKAFGISEPAAPEPHRPVPRSSPSSQP